MFKLRTLLRIAGGVGALALTTLLAMRARRKAARIGTVAATVTINRPVRDVHELLHDSGRLRILASYLESVEDAGDQSALTLKLPVVGRVRLMGDVELANAPHRESTEVRITVELTGSEKLARVAVGPLLKGDLRRIKQVLETGEVLRSDASAHLLPHAAQPAPDAMPAPDLYIPHVANVQKGAVS